MKRIVMIVYLLAACLLTACASTAIERGPEGFRYYSDKNVALEGLDIERTTKPDGTVVEKIKVGKAGGDASSVNAHWAAIIGELVRRIPGAGGVSVSPEPMNVRPARDPSLVPNEGDWN